MTILGFSAFNHDAAAAVFEGGMVKAAFENDKLARSRTVGLPESAAQFCLEKTAKSWRDLDAIAVASRPTAHWGHRLLSSIRLLGASPIGSMWLQANELGLLAREQTLIGTLQRRCDQRSRIIKFDHHLCHAASAFYFSPFDRSLIVTMDEEGDGVSGTIAIGEGTQIRTLRIIPFPHSVAWMYTQVSELLGFKPHQDEHKTQWLSLDGESVFCPLFLKMLRNP